MVVLVFWAARFSSRVDFPIPGSPVSRVTAPGTSPPPSTRFISDMFVFQGWAWVVFICFMGWAWVMFFLVVVVWVVVVSVSVMFPQVWQFGQRPTHFRVFQLHSLQW